MNVTRVIAALAFIAALIPAVPAAAGERPVNEWREETDESFELRPWGSTASRGQSGFERSSRLLGEVNGTCDGTCNRGKPCICNPDCPCRKPPICSGHYLEIDRSQVNSQIQSITESLISRYGGSVGTDLAAKSAGDINVSGDLGGGVKAGATDSGSKSGSGSVKAEGSESSEKREKNESSSKLSLSGKIALGTEQHSSPGVILIITGRATLEVVTEIYRSQTITVRPWTYSNTTSVRYGGSTSIGIKVENKIDPGICPCRGPRPEKDKGDGDGNGKEEKEKGVYLGGSDKESYVAVRNHEPDSEGKRNNTVRVQVDGKEVAKDDYRAAPGKKDPSITVYRIRHSSDPSMGATINVVDKSGNEHEISRPPDSITLVNRVNVSRNRTTTTVTVSPEVKKKAPDGSETVASPKDSPTGEPPTVFLKDDKGFWTDVGDFLNKTIPGILIPVGTTLMLNRSAKGGSSVVSNPDGSTSINIPNEVYDPAVEKARKTNPDFGPGDVAGGVGTGLGLSEGANPISGLAIVSYCVVGGSPTDVQTGSEVVFVLRTQSATVSQASVTVPLEANGAGIGFMKVSSVSTAGEGMTTVSATIAEMPPGVEDFSARVGVGAAQSNAVRFSVARNSVDLTALQKIVTEGNIVTLMLRSPSGGRIAGTLSITGPGKILPGMTQSVKVDATGSISYQVETDDPGMINATFTPETSKPGSDLGGFLDKAGIAMDDLKME